MAKFLYNKKELRFDKKKFSIWRALLVVGKYVLFSLLVAVIYYAIYSIFFSTDREKQLIAERDYMEREYDRMKEQIEIVESVVEGLEARDRQIYNDIFHSAPPTYMVGRDTGRMDMGTIYEEDENDLIWNVNIRASRLESISGRINTSIENIYHRLSAGETDWQSIPSIIPVKNFSIARTGASVGNKFSPFYKTLRLHTGFDILSPVGTEVLAAASGTVTFVTRGTTAWGRRIEITHSGGIVTTYSHLQEIMVKKGQQVQQSDIIGRVGNSGTSFAPHLHYEVIVDGNHVDPINYFFADITPSAYQEMMMIALSTGQSMD
ncbi:MAG TPA: M23 family metallopeptidase [Bacteroidales bacterium]|nr:M23 family metallopeptidase [Bacteroidales bacterium]